MDTTKLVSLLVRWLVLALAVWIAAEIVPGIHLEGWQSTLAVALILGLLNMYLRPLLTFVTLPLTLITLGLFLLVINAILLGLTDWIANLSGEIRFDIDGILAAIWGGAIISLVSTILGIFIKPERIARNVTRR